MFRSASRPLTGIVLGLALLLLLPGAALAEAFVIDRYHVDIQVEDDTRIHIRETIAVNFTQPRRGIIRDIPLRFAGLPVRIEDIRVDSHPSETEHSRQTASIRIGDPDVIVTGPAEYLIRYTLVPGGSFATDPALLYLNLIGHDWDTTIAEASFEIRLPSPIDPHAPNITVGPVGSERTDGVTWQATETTISGQTERPLAPFEGVTVYLELPAGYYTGYSEPLTFLTWLIPAAALVLLGLIGRIWYTKGRDNPLVITPEFYPPENITPPEAGYILNRNVTPQDVTSLILHWASRGLLTVEQTGRKHFRLIREAELTDPAGHFEGYFFGALFAHGRRDEVLTSELEGAFHEEMNTARGLVASHFTDSDDRRFYEKGSVALSVLGTFCSLLPLWALASYTMFRNNSFHWDLSVTVMGLLLGLFVFLGITLFNHSVTKLKSRTTRSGITALLFTLIPFLGGLGVLGVLTLGQDLFPLFLPVAASSWLMNLWGQLSTKRTAYGDRMLGLVLGFRRFLRTAEKERIERLLEDNPSYFYDTLPYAQVLGVTKKWAHKFSGLSMEPPRWYRGTYGSGPFNAYLFATGLNRSMGAMTSGISHDPRKNSGGSGFGGGGFSGGGAGGGGGRSW